MAASYLSRALGLLAATPHLEPQRAPFRSQRQAAPFDTVSVPQPTSARADPSRPYSVAGRANAPPLMLYDDPRPADDAPPPSLPTVDPVTEPHLAALGIARQLPISAPPLTRPADPVIDMPAVEAMIPAPATPASSTGHHVQETFAAPVPPPRSHAPHPMPVPPASGQHGVPRQAVQRCRPRSASGPARSRARWRRYRRSHNSRRSAAPPAPRGCRRSGRSPQPGSASPHCTARTPIAPRTANRPPGGAMPPPSRNTAEDARLWHAGRARWRRSPRGQPAIPAPQPR